MQIANRRARDPQPSLLVIDGGASGRAALCAALDGLVFAEVNTVAGALARLRGGEHDCALLDLRVSGLDGLAVLQAAREAGVSTPIIVLAARVDEHAAVEMIRAGAMDYIPAASVSAERLRQSVSQAMRVRRAEVTAARERQRLDRLQRFTAALAAKRTVVEVAESSAAELQRAFEAPRALFAVVGDADDRIHVVRVDGFEERTIEPWREMPLDAPLPIPEAMRQSVPLFFENSAALIARYPALAAQRVSGDEALVVLPLVIERRAIGCVALIYDQPRAFTADDRQELLGLARACAQALDRAYLFDIAQLERRRAEEANRAKDEFLAVVSHELRTPLNAILGWAKMLNAGSLNREQARKATLTIERNAEAQAQLVDDLLDVSRIVTGQMRIKCRPVELAAVLSAAIDIVRPAAEAKGVQLEADFEQAASPVLGDADRLQQVFWNLLSNAVKFTPGGGRVVVRLRQVEDALLVQVEDSGQGIPQEFLPEVFQRFRLQDASTARKTGGLGLGLAIVRHLVELHGGQVAVASEGPGKGSTLSVRLPVNPGRGAASEAPPISERRGSDARASAARPLHLDGIHALVVDDDVDARELITSLLEEQHARVTAVASAREAYERLRAERPNILVSDIGMPIEDGYSLMERVRALPAQEGGRTPAIALTAYAHAADRARALLAGFTAHATKPVDPRELVRLIASITTSNPAT